MLESVSDGWILPPKLDDHGCLKLSILIPGFLPTLHMLLGYKDRKIKAHFAYISRSIFGMADSRLNRRCRFSTHL